MSRKSNFPSWEEREREIRVNLGETLHHAEVLEEAVLARLKDPLLAPKSKAGLRQILKTAHRLQRTLR